MSFCFILVVFYFLKMSTPHSHRSPCQVLSGSSKTQQWPVSYQSGSGTLLLNDLATCFRDLGGERKAGVQLQGWKCFSLRLLDTDQSPASQTSGWYPPPHEVLRSNAPSSLCSLSGFLRVTPSRVVSTKPLMFISGKPFIMKGNWSPFLNIFFVNKKVSWKPKMECTMSSFT